MITIEKWAAECFAAMKLNSIKRKDLSKATGYSEEYVSMVMNGKRTSETAQNAIKQAVKKLSK